MYIKCNKRSILTGNELWNWPGDWFSLVKELIVKKGACSGLRLITRWSVLLLYADGHSQTRQRLGGLHQLLMESSATLQHLGQLLQLHVHLVAVVFVNGVHAFLHLLAHFCHLSEETGLTSALPRAGAGQEQERWGYLGHQLLLEAVHHSLITGSAVVNLFYKILHFSADLIDDWTVDYGKCNGTSWSTVTWYERVEMKDYLN